MDRSKYKFGNHAIGDQVIGRNVIVKDVYFDTYRKYHWFIGTITSKTDTQIIIDTGTAYSIRTGRCLTSSLHVIYPSNEQLRKKVSDYKKAKLLELFNS